MDRHIILAVSGKGGTGKTTVGAAVCACLAALGKKTLIIDCDVGLRNTDVVLGLSDRAVMDFSDVLDGRIPAEAAVIEHPDVPNLAVLPAPVTDEGFDVAKFAQMAAEYRNIYDYVWLDGPAGLGPWVRGITSAVGRIVVITTPEVACVRDAACAAALTDDGPRGWLIVNRVIPKLVPQGGAMLIDDIMDEVGLPLLGLIPEDGRVIVAGNRGIPIIRAMSDGAALAARNIALRLLGHSVPLFDFKKPGRVGKNFLRTAE